MTQEEDYVRVDPVDPRDVVWEQDSPVFRVHLQRRAPGGIEPAGMEVQEFEIREADVGDVLAWLAERKDTWESFVLYLHLTSDAPPGPGIVRLGGEDATK